MEKTQRFRLEDALTPQMNKKKNQPIAGKNKKSFLNPLLLSTVSKLCFLPRFIPSGPCSVHRPSCSRNSHLYPSLLLQTNLYHVQDVGQGCGTAPGVAGSSALTATFLCQSTREARHTLFQHNKMQGDSVEGRGKSGGLCNTACSLCCSFSLKMLFDHRSKIIHLCHLLPFRAAATFLGCRAKPETAQHNEACEVCTAPVNTELTLMPTSEAIQTV